MELLEAFADQMLLMLQAERRFGDWEELQNIAREVVKFDPRSDQKWQSIVRRGSRMMQVDRCYLSVNRRDMQLVVASTQDDLRGKLLDPNASIAGLAIESGVSNRVGDLHGDHSRAKYAPLWNGSKSALVAPLELDGIVRGVLALESVEEQYFSVQDEKLAQLVADYATLALRMEQQARDLEEFIEKEKQAALAAKWVHQVGNPIRTMHNWLNWLNESDQREPEERSPRVAKVLRHIGESVIQLRKVVDGLSKTLSEAAIYTQHININAYVEEALEKTTEACCDSGVVIHRKLSQELPAVLADRNLVDVFVEMIHNALDAMPDGGSIEFETRLQQNKLEVRITDTGKGISSRRLDHIFDPAFSGKKDRTEADGLGLAWCKWYLGAIGGDVSVTSTPGKGTTMKIILGTAPVEPPNFFAGSLTMTTTALSSEK